MEDNELLYYFLVVKNEVAFLFLHERYQQLTKQTVMRVYRKFCFVPLELMDLESICYYSFYQSIHNYQSWRKMTFKSFF